MAAIDPLHDRKTIDEGQKNRSFADPRLEVLHAIALKTQIKPANRIVFLHPPKTGGTNLVFVVEALDKSKKLKCKRFAVKRIPKVSPILITEGWLGGLLTAKEALAENPNSFKGADDRVLTQVQAFSSLCKDHNFMSGHFPFGMISLISDRNIGLMREPLSRELSSLNFDFQRGFVNKTEAEEYLLKKQMDNPQTRLFAGEQYMSGPCTLETFAKAKDNIERHFFLVGITEEVNLFIQIIASIQNFGNLALCRSQVTGEKIFKELPPHIHSELIKKHEYDIKLYEWVKERWCQWKKDNLLPAKPLEPDSKTPILCITAEFASTKAPIFLTMDQIDQHNKKYEKNSCRLIEVPQNHSEVKPLNGNTGLPAKAAEKPLLLTAFATQNDTQKLGPNVTGVASPGAKRTLS